MTFSDELQSLRGKCSSIFLDWNEHRKEWECLLIVNGERFLGTSEYPGNALNHAISGARKKFPEKFTITQRPYLNRINRRPPSPAEIIELRVSMEMSQPEFARKIGVSNVAIWKWENGVYKPRQKNAAKLRRLMDEIEMCDRTCQTGRRS